MNEIVSNGYLRQVVHAICLGGASTLTLTALTTPANAAPAESTSATDSELSEIVVAISAEDIGKFPDANLAVAMERIPGVTISRAAVTLTGTGSTSTAGSGTQITVRGFGPQFNETLFDGRQVPTALGNRGFDFGSVGSEFIGQVDVLKTPDASLSSGAIGATINIKYPKPFDHPGMQLAGSLSGTDSSGDNQKTPNASLLFSDTFADDRFGVLIDGAYADTKVRGNHVNIQGWEGGRGDGNSGLAACQLAGNGPCATAPGSATNPPTIKDWFIQDYGIYQEHTEDKRVG